MRVFSVEMLVKEEGAATVQAALNRLKKETQAVAADMRTTAQAVTGTGNAMQGAAQKTQIAGDRAAKAAIGFAAVGQSIARTGSITADAGTRIIEAGSQIAMMFGPKGLAVAALLGFVTAAITSFGKASAEAKKMEEDFKKSLESMVNQGDLIGLTKKLRDLEMGTPYGKFEKDVINVNDGLVAMKARLKEIEPLFNIPGFTRLNPEVRRLRDDIKKAEGEARDLRAAIFGASMPAGEPGASAVTITGAAPSAKGGETFKKDFDVYGSARDSALKAFEAQQAEIAKRGPIQVFPPEFLDNVKADLEKTAVEIEKAGLDAMMPVGATIASGLSEGIAQSIEGGILSGLEMAIASGSISEGFRAMGQAIVRSMAQAMVKVAVAAIGLGAKLKAIKEFMVLHPGLAVASAIALLALAQSMGGGASGGNMTAMGGPGGLTYSAAGSALPTQQIIFGATSATTAAGMQPRQSMNVTVIGPNDPSAQRAIQELMAKADSRGRIG